MIAGDKVKINLQTSFGSIFHNGKFFEREQYHDKEFTVGDVDETSCYIVELKHRFAKWVLKKV